MPMRYKPTANAAGQVIEYTDLNQVRRFYDFVWGDINTTSAFSDSDNTEHRYGWGQAEPTIGTAAPKAIIESAHLNELVAQVNAGRRHQDTNNTLIAFYRPDPNFGTTPEVIDAVHLNTVSNNIDAMISNKYDLGSDATQVSSAITISESVPWENGYYCIARYDFTDYAQARYFFNTGGTLRVELDQSGGAPASIVWDNIFNSIGEMYIGAEETTNTPGPTPIPTYGLSSGGFYDMNNKYNASNWRLLFTANGSGGTYSYSGYSSYAYSSYGGMYSSRQVRLYGYCRDTVSSFQVFIKVLLIEDADDGIMDGTFDADFGYIMADQSPNASAMLSSVANYVTVNGTQFIFDPTRYTWTASLPVTEVVTWTQDNSWAQ